MLAITAAAIGIAPWSMDATTLTLVSVLLAVALLARLLTSAWANALVWHLAARSKGDLQLSVLRRLLRVPLGFFQRVDHGRTATLVRPILVDDGWTEGRIELYVVIAGSGVGIVAGLLAGALISTVGRHRSLAVLGALQVLAALATIAIAQGWTAPGVVLAVVGTSTAAFTAATAIAYTIVMGLARPESAGSFGFTPVLVAAAILALVGLVVVLVMAPRISG